MSQQRLQEIEMLIRFYNMQASTSCKVSNENNQKAMSDLLDVYDGNVAQVKVLLREKAPEYKFKLIDCLSDLRDEKLLKDTEVPVETPTPVQAIPQVGQPIGDTQVQYGMGLLEQAVVQLIANQNASKLEDAIKADVQNKFESFIKETYGTLERKIITYVDGVKVELEGTQHEKFETVLKFVSNNEPVFLTGPAGSGKNVLCKQVAKALNLDFYFTNAVTQEYKITGFTDAMGKYQESQFYKAFKNGGLFMLDEMDASIPEVLVILNSAIANRYFDFPAPIGYVEAHPDFRVISAGNTFGLGADYDYVGRNQLDMASLDRFALVPIDYSPSIELSVTGGDRELVEFCRDFRATAKRNGVRVLISYRGMGRYGKSGKATRTIRIA